MKVSRWLLLWSWALTGSLAHSITNSLTPPDSHWLSLTLSLTFTGCLADSHWVSLIHSPTRSLTTTRIIKLAAINSLAPGRCESNIESIIFEFMSSWLIFSISCEIALRWMLQIFLQMIGWGNAIRQQAITRANVDPNLYQHMTSLGHNEFMCGMNTYR